MLWFLFQQNNSGGSFVRNENVDHFVFIEAEDALHANKYAKLHGIYFDGVSKGYDCECCGDRWEEALDNKVDNYSVFNEIPPQEEWFTKKYFRESIFYFRNGFKTCGKNMKWRKIIDSNSIPSENNIVEPQQPHRRLELS